MSIKLENVNYFYSQGTAYEKQALKDINLEIKKGEFVGIAGHTGSGKSTLIQHLNGLEKATSGTITYDGQDIYKKDFDLDSLRRKVGLTFQYPEYQLFEATVFEDVCFGPKNQGFSEEEVKERAREALQLVGFPEELYDKSPFQLSGGQKRRVAIAGVLAMNPEYLILDEPAAGLDPIGRTEILDQIKKLHDEKGIAVILVSHSMEDLAHYVDRLIVMNHGEKVFDDTPKNVFAHYKELEWIGLSAPEVTYIMNELKEKGFPVRTDIIHMEEATKEILRVLKKGGERQ
ncbi:MAG TPA: energy-coupling factor transporter ATPase [Lachnospiraceae bacterium]|nr:energy-coupling factor transporter ATPase [Lachnospiraceae bacterium]HIS60830.1 energy-coupling factor transporter ATPase [Candidatus Scybalomonas excrementigallinarum]